MGQQNTTCLVVPNPKRVHLLKITPTVLWNIAVPTPLGSRNTNPSASNGPDSVIPLKTTTNILPPSGFIIADGATTRYPFGGSKPQTGSFVKNNADPDVHRDCRVTLTQTCQRPTDLTALFR
jgi:hypothetical protein